MSLLYFQRRGRQVFLLTQKSPLFAGISENELSSLLTCLSAKRRRYGKGSFVFSEGQRPDAIGVVLAGRIHVLKEDIWGNQNLLTEIGAGDLFAEAFVCACSEELPVSAVAMEETEAILLDYRRVVTTCTSACVFHAMLIANMLRVLARKNILLVNKLEHITKRTIREKLLSYLSEQAKQSAGRVFAIPFNRQQLADYLSVERSALSAELSRMRDDGLIVFRKNHFELLI